MKEVEAEASLLGEIEDDTRRRRSDARQFGRSAKEVLFEFWLGLVTVSSQIQAFPSQNRGAGEIF